MKLRSSRDPRTARSTSVEAVVRCMLAAWLILALAGCASDQEENTVDDGAARAAATEATEPSTAEGQDLLVQATAFWQALAAGDRRAALSLVDPDETESGRASPYGRAQTLAGQFDWYEAVGWRWTLDECRMVDSERAQCSATAGNPWSDVLGVEPVTGQFLMTFSDAGITSVSAGGRFKLDWGSTVFEPFADWVEQNHPEDAAAMFADKDVDADILDLYEVNTERFVEAHDNG